MVILHLREQATLRWSRVKSATTTYSNTGRRASVLTLGFRRAPAHKTLKKIMR